MITLTRLDLVRQSSPATADELQSLQTQLNALPALQVNPTLLSPEEAVQMRVPVAPSGFLEIRYRGEHYVLPFYRKGE